MQNTKVNDMYMEGYHAGKAAGKADALRATVLACFDVQTLVDAAFDATEHNAVLRKKMIAEFKKRVSK